jgi:glycosyltransferase involved in cell wall biosynthesis
MRVLMLSEFYPPCIGGMERHVQTLSRELVRRGHHVAVATLQHRESPAFEDDEGVRVHRLTGWNRALAPFYENQKRQFHLPLPDPGVMAGLGRVMEQERPDIVHARGWMLYSFVGLKAWSKTKLVVTLHDYRLHCPTMVYLHNGQVCTGPSYAKCILCASSKYGGGKAVLLTSGLKLSGHLHRYVDQYIAISSAIRDASIVATNRALQPIEVVPTFIADTAVDEANHVGRPAFLPPTDDYILFVGRHDPNKGLDILLDAYTELSDLAPLVVMIVDYGDSSKQFPAGVTVVRNAPHDQIMAAWMHCAVGVVPSLSEAFGQVAVEAMICGKPVVASAVGGLRDAIIDGVSGLLVPPGDASALREALRALLLDPARRVQMGAIGRQRARLFTVGTVADRIEQIYAELLSENQGSRTVDHCD